ncbi:hypothetical protein EFB08_08220 [Rufibacter latericius]|uniref:Uncharacterized protein n=1 Tax=Rufibacter latericius TaxID=2487040 RepID=A0A3M9MTW0_9BACT|nr:hypothetical protein EFB08_08220 [Rufibacter latericius]
MNYSRRPQHSQQKSTYENVMKYVSLLMVLLYFGFGLYVLFSSEKQIPFPRDYKYIFGGLLLFYGLIRFVRAYQQYFKKTRRNEED